MYYGYRFYAPEAGRWLTRDPLGEAGGLNLYAFTGNNPVNWIDPWGLISDWRPVPTKKGWEFRHDKALCEQDYPHDHFRKRGKEIARKVNSKTGEQKKHGKGKDQDVPEDVIKATQKGMKFTGIVSFDLFLFEFSEAVDDAATYLNELIPPPPLLPLPDLSPVPGGVPSPVLCPL